MTDPLDKAEWLLREFVTAWDAGERESLWRGIEEARHFLSTRPVGGFTPRTEVSRVSAATFADGCPVCGTHRGSEAHGADPRRYHAELENRIAQEVRARGTPGGSK